eukprot:gene6104-7071_t
MNTHLFGSQPYSESEYARISAELHENTRESDISVRPGPGNTRLSYIESWRAIEIANRIFGFNGWSSQIIELQTDFIDDLGMGKYRVGSYALIRILLKDGTYHDDVGYGTSENPSKGTAIENSKKEAVSDGRKRALRVFGLALGNQLYDKDVNKQHSAPKKKVPTTTTAATTTPAPAPQQPVPQQQQPAVVKPALQQPQMKPAAQPLRATNNSTLAPNVQQQLHQQAHQQHIQHQTEMMDHNNGGADDDENIQFDE